MARDIKAFAVSGYASALFNGLPVVFAPKQLLIHVPMMSAGLFLVVLAWAAATNWRLWLGWVLAVIAVVFSPVVRWRCAAYRSARLDGWSRTCLASISLGAVLSVGRRGRSSGHTLSQLARRVCSRPWPDPALRQPCGEDLQRSFRNPIDRGRFALLPQSAPRRPQMRRNLRRC